MTSRCSTPKEASRWSYAAKSFIKAANPLLRESSLTNAADKFRLRCSQHFYGLDGITPRSEFFKTIECTSPGLFTRLGRVYDSVTQVHRRVHRIFGDPKLDWLEILLLEATQFTINLWPRRCHACPAMTADMVESILEANSFPRELLIQAAFQPDLQKFSGLDAEILYLSLKGLNQSAVRHRQVVLSALGNQDFKQRLHALAMLKKSRAEVAQFQDKVVELSVDSSKQVRELAASLLEPVKTTARPLIEAKALQGSNGERPLAVTLLWAFYGEDARPFLETRLIKDCDLPREAIPTQWLNELEVWDALLQRMPMTALVRNLGKMSAIGLVKPFSQAASLVVNKLKDEALLKRARIHPLAVLIAQKVYAQGRGEKGSLSWKPVPKIIDALDAAFYATFQNVEPCGKPVLLALDVSGSMDGSMIAGSCLSAREASAAMALVTAATEPDCEIIAFSATSGGYGGMHGGGESGITRVALSPRMRLDSVIEKVRAIPMGGTDCALPMVWARRNQLRVSAFVTYTDSETWAGKIHPAQALRQYRDEFVGDAKAVVVGMTSNGFTLADPNDRGMLDVVGFDTSVPAVISDFVRAA